MQREGLRRDVAARAVGRAAQLSVARACRGPRGRARACERRGARAHFALPPRRTFSPCQIEVAEGGISQEPSEFSAELAARLLPKLDWAALRKTVAELGIAELPEAPPARPEEDEAFLRSLHDLVMDVHVTEGALVCPNCARAFPIRKGIPNMLLREDEL